MAPAPLLLHPTPESKHPGQRPRAQNPLAVLYSGCVVTTTTTAVVVPLLFNLLLSLPPQGVPHAPGASPPAAQQPQAAQQQQRRQLQRQRRGQKQQPAAPRAHCRSGSSRAVRLPHAASS